MRRTRERNSTTLADRPLDGFALSAGKPPAVSSPGHNAPARMPGRTADISSTRQAVGRHAAMPAEAAGHFANLAVATAGARDLVDDDQARRNAGVTDGVIDERTPQNLPAVISSAIVEGADGTVVPEWHMVRHLPGYVQQGIRAMSRAVFNQFTDVPVDDIQTVTTLSNDRVEVQALMGWITRNGIRDDAADLDFSQSMPGYKADVQLWNAKGYGFLLVKDFAGYYVYGWPGGRGVHLEDDYEAPKMLR